jgi:hypothetical protein
MSMEIQYKDVVKETKTAAIVVGLMAVVGPLLVIAGVLISSIGQ